jgi:integrating conjugative element protein (TIGR03757 family)
MNKFLSCLLIFFSVSTQASSIRIDLFVEKTESIDSIPGVELIIHDLSAPDTLHRQYLPSALSADPATAKVQAQAFFSSPRGREYTSRLQAAYAHKGLMMRYNIQKIPAMVFDGGKAVIYGSTNIEMGIQLYQGYLKKMGEQEDEK